MAKAITIKVPNLFTIQIPPSGADGRTTALTSLRWVLGSWELAVRDTTKKGDRSREEVRDAIEEIARQLKPHLSEPEWDRFKFYLVKDDCTLDSLRGPNA